MSGSIENNQITITILFDNYAISKGLKSGWGFSCIIENTEKTILFDTGGDGDILFFNINRLNVNPKDVEYIVISHNHWDHTGGLSLILEKNNNVSLYLPASDDDVSIKKVETLKILFEKEPVEICRDVFLTGEMGTYIKEQSIVLNTEKGLVVITGCAHPGIVDIIKRAKKIIDKDVYMVLGGFHLMDMSDDEINKVISEFRDLGVLKIGPTHCTGEKAIKLFKGAYGEDFVKIGVGKVLRF